MRLSYLFIIPLLFLFACGGDSGSAPATAVPADFTGYSVVDVPGSTSQKATKVNENGEIVEEGYILNGKKSGTWYTFHGKTEAERIKTISNYVNGIKNGPFMEFNDRGQVVLQCFYTNDQFDGTWTKYRFGSRKEKEATYKMGVMNGMYREFHSNGKLMKEVPYVNDKMHGKFRQFNDNDELVIEYEFNMGEKVTGGIVK